MLSFVIVGFFTGKEASIPIKANGPERFTMHLRCFEEPKFLKK